MKISFITTVLNEEKSVGSLLKSINSQSVLPHEVVICDGGSSDNTLNEIEKFVVKKENKLKIKVIKINGNRSKGRNMAIAESSGEIIACTDVGCIPDKNWLRNITEPFKNDKIDVSAGYYKPLTENNFQKSLAAYTCVMPDKLDENNFLPSSRSIAFRKKVWEKVEGYPEFLDTCEDLYFAREVQKKGFIFKTVVNAVVFWPQRKNFYEAFIQFYKYAKGDGMARFFRKSTPFLFGRYILGIFLLYFFLIFHSISGILLLFSIFFIYLIWSITKNFKYVNDHSAIFYLPVLQIISDVAVILGTSAGFLKGIGLKR